MKSWINHFFSLSLSNLFCTEGMKTVVRSSNMKLISFFKKAGKLSVTPCYSRRVLNSLCTCSKNLPNSSLTNPSLPAAQHHTKKINIAWTKLVSSFWFVYFVVRFFFLTDSLSFPCCIKVILLLFQAITEGNFIIRVQRTSHGSQWPGSS